MADDHGHAAGGGDGGHAEGGEDHGKGHKSHGSHGPGHGGGHEEHAGAPEWLISFADNTALLMGFFVILLAMNMSPKNKPGGDNTGIGPGGFTEERAKMIELEWGIREAFHNKPRPDSKNPADVKLFNDHQKLHGLDGTRKTKNTGMTGDNPGKPTVPEVGTKIAPVGIVEFDNGSVVLSPQQRMNIRKLVAGELKGKDWIVEIRGHVAATEARAAERAAGADPDGSTTPGDNVGSGAGYALSYARAFAVATEMARQGLPWRQMRIVACSDMQRAVARADSNPDANRRNSRVEVIQSTDPIPKDPLAEADSPN
jgi:outer membrane protein OmpA-like peptidoglycan-associated protein